MKILFVAGVAPVVRDAKTSRRFYVDDLGMPLEGCLTYTPWMRGQ